MPDIRVPLIFEVKGNQVLVSSATQLDNLGSTAKKTQASLGGASGAFAEMAKVATAMTAGFTAGLAIMAAVGRSVVQLALNVGALGGRLDDLSLKTGLSREALQELEFAAKMGSTNLETLTKGVNQLQKQLIQGSAESERAFKGLGLETEKLRQMMPEQAFKLIGDRIRELKNPTDQAAAAMSIFGRSGAELLPAFKAGLSEASEEARRLGLVLSEDAVRAADEFGDEVDKLKMAWEGVLNQLGAAIVQSPEIIQLMKDLTSTLADVSRIIVENKDEIVGFFNSWASGARLAFAEMNKLLNIKPAGSRAGSGLGVEFGPTLGPGGVPERELSLRSIAQDRAEAEARKQLKQDLDREKVIREGLARAIEAGLGAQAEAAEKLLFEGRLRTELAEASEKARIARMRETLGLEELFRVVDKSTGLWTRYPDVVEQELENANAAVEKHVSALSEAFADLPNVILGALQGGGDVGKSIGGLLGGAIGKDLGKALGGVLGSFLPGVGSLLGAGIGGLADKLLGGLFGGKEKEVNKLRDQFITASGGLENLKREAAAAGVSLDRLFAAKDSAKGLQAAIDDITGKLGAWDEAQAALNDAVQRYGFSIEELGPKFAQQKLDEQAAGLLKDYQLLTAAGIDVNTVIAKMGPNMVEFVNQARAAGATIPEAMRPMIDQLIASGQLVDENGNAFKSAEEAGVTFAETMTEAMSRAADAIERLVAALTGAGNAARNIPPINIPIGAGGRDDTFAPSGKYLPDVSAASGFDGMVSRPTLFLAGEAGRERVTVTPSGGDGAVPIRTTVVIDGRALFEAMTEGIRENRYQSKSKMNIALGR